MGAQTTTRDNAQRASVVCWSITTRISDNVHSSADGPCGNSVNCSAIDLPRKPLGITDVVSLQIV